jgi:phage-related protein
MATVADLVIQVDANVNRAIKGLTVVTAALNLAPAGAAATAALMGITAGAAAAGAGVGAFALAAKPAVEEVTEAMKLQEAAIAATAQGGAAATAAQKKYNEAVAALSPHQRALMTQMNGLKTEYKDWSKSLQSSTLPVFTNGVKLLRTILPQLTPFVKQAGAALNEFVLELQAGAQSAGFKKFMAELARFSGPNLKNFLGTIKNLIKGFGGLIAAFLPMSTKMTGGLERMTAAFADWATGLSNSDGFGQFQEMASAGGGALKQLAGAFIELVSAAAPLIQAATGITTAFAKIIANTPEGVLVGIGTAILAVKAGLMAYRAYILITTAATRAWALATAIASRTLMLSPVGLIIGLIAGLVAIIVVIATKTTWFQTAWKYTWNAIKAVTLAVWNWIKSFLTAAFEVIKWLFLNFSGPGLIIKHWNTIKRVTLIVWNAIKAALSAVWNWIKATVSGTWNWLKRQITTGWNGIKNVTTRVWNGIKSFLSSVINGIKNFVTTRINNTKTNVTNAFNVIRTMITNAINRARSAVTAAVNKIGAALRSIKGKVTGALSGAASWLFNAGKSIIRGLINGIKSMASSVTSAVKGIVSKARDLLPFSPAKEGPFSGRGYTLYSGQALMKDWAKGMESRAALPVQTAARTAAAVQRGTAVRARTGAQGPQAGSASWLALARAAIQARQTDGRIEIDVTGSDEDMKRLIRKMVRLNGRGGSVQTAFGGR